MFVIFIRLAPLDGLLNHVVIPLSSWFRFVRSHDFSFSLCFSTSLSLSLAIVLCAHRVCCVFLFCIRYFVSSILSTSVLCAFFYFIVVVYFDVFQVFDYRVYGVFISMVPLSAYTYIHRHSLKSRSSVRFTTTI